MEGFDLPVLEALACGARVVASDIDVHREHFGSVVTLFRSGDAANMAEQIVVTVHQDDVTRDARMAFAREFTWDRAARRVIALWDDVTG